MNKTAYPAILIVTAVLTLSACGGGSSSKSEPAPAEPAATEPAAAEATAAEPAKAVEPAPSAQPAGSSATAGQKLIDLNKAREAGAISDEEYEAAKKRILDTQ